MKLHPQEVVIHENDHDPIRLSEFIEDRMAGSEEILEADFATSRDWESEETEDGFTINTTPDPTLKLFETANGMVAVFCVKVGDPLVHTAVLAGHDDIRGMLSRAVESIEDNFDGIKHVTGVSHNAFGDGILSHIHDCVDDVTPDDA